MPSEKVRAAFLDMSAVERIETRVKAAGGVDPALTAGSQSRSAIERQLLVISEAAARLHRSDPSAAEQLAPNVDWPGVRGIGNFIRHKYDDLDAAIIADVVGAKLAALRIACAAALKVD